MVFGKIKKMFNDIPQTCHGSLTANASHFNFILLMMDVFRNSVVFFFRIILDIDILTLVVVEMYMFIM